MLSNRLIRWAVVLVCILGVYGCSKKTTTPPPPGPTDSGAAAQEVTKTEAEYKAEADKQITEQNAGDELKKLEQEVNADADQS